MLERAGEIPPNEIHSVREILENHLNNTQDLLNLIISREHMAKPFPGTNYEYLAINVPSTFQQGLIPDGDELPHGLLRTVVVANELSDRVKSYPKVNAGILDAHRLKLKPDEIKEQLSIISPKVVGLNPTSVNVPEAQVIAQICKELNIDFILGGIHATLDPKAARWDFPDAAAIVRGQGEFVLAPVVKGIIENCPPLIKGVYYPNTSHSATDYAQGLNPQHIPLVRQDIYAVNPIYSHSIEINGEKRDIKEANLFVTYGCPFECTFCSSPVMVNRGAKGVKPYQRPKTSKIIDDIELSIVSLGADAIHFLDDMAFVTQEHIADFHSGLKDRGLLGSFVWRAMTRAPIITRFNQDTIVKMKETGVWKVALGVESGNNDILRKIRKKVDTRQVIEAVNKLTSHGIQSKGFFIIGFPGETEEQMLETKRLILQLKDQGMTEAAIFQFKPYPGTIAFADLIIERPDILPQLHYIRHSSLSSDEKVKYRAEQHDTWLPPNLKIADVSSGRVQEIVIDALEDFYGSDITSEEKELNYA